MNFPERTKLNKIMPKAKFIKMIGFNAPAKNEFQANVERLVLANILRKDTINIVAGKNVQEINVLELTLKTKSVSDNLLKEIDAVVPKYLIYLLKYQDKVQLAINYKEKSGSNNKFKVLTTYRTDWIESSDFNLKIEGLNLDTVLNNFIIQLADGRIETTENTEIKDAVEKSIDIDKLEKKLTQAQKKMWNEKQANTQLELSREVKKLKKTLEKMTDG